MKIYKLNDILILKKYHACGENQWLVIRTGADIKLKCLKCNHEIMIDRLSLEKRIKKVVENNAKN